MTMHTVRWRTSFGLLTVISIASLVWLMSSPHRVRLIAGSYEYTDSALDLPTAATFRYMNHISEPANGFEEAIRALRSFDSMVKPRHEDPMPAIDDPDTSLALLAEGKRLHCYNADIGAVALLAKYGIKARLWDLKGPDELGGLGHNMLEVHTASNDAWYVVDPYYFCYFTIGQDSTPANFPALRLALLRDTGLVHIHHYYHVVDERPDPYVLPELQYLVPASLLHANNDFRWRYDHRYAWLMPFAPLFDKLSLRVSRGVRMILLGSQDRRYFIQDSHSPHFPIATLKFVHWALLIVVIVSFALFCWSLVPRRKTIVVAAPTQSVISSAPRTISTL